MTAHPEEVGTVDGAVPGIKIGPPIEINQDPVQGLIHRVRDETTEDRSRLILTTLTGNTTIRWLVDTGAVVSLLSFAVWADLAVKPTLKEEWPVIIGATGTNISVKGTSTLSTQLGGEELTLEVIVADIAVPAIMGMDTLRSWGAIIDTEGGTIDLAPTSIGPEDGRGPPEETPNTMPYV